MKNYFQKYYFIVFSILFISCKSTIQTKSNIGKIGSSVYYILEFKPNDRYPVFENAKRTELSHAEIVEIEELIKTQIKETTSEFRNETQNRLPEDEYQYDRQYIAAKNELGEKLVWINFFCANDMEEIYDLKQERTNVADGGKCFFELEVNLTTKTIIGYKHNFMA